MDGLIKIKQDYKTWSNLHTQRLKLAHKFDNLHIHFRAIEYVVIMLSILIGIFFVRFRRHQELSKG